MVSLSICPNERVISSVLTSGWVDDHFRSEIEFTVHKRLLLCFIQEIENMYRVSIEL